MKWTQDKCPTRLKTVSISVFAQTNASNNCEHLAPDPQKSAMHQQAWCCIRFQDDVLLVSSSHQSASSHYNISVGCVIFYPYFFFAMKYWTSYSVQRLFFENFRRSSYDFSSISERLKLFINHMFRLVLYATTCAFSVRYRHHIHIHIHQWTCLQRLCLFIYVYDASLRTSTRACNSHMTGLVTKVSTRNTHVVTSQCTSAVMHCDATVKLTSTVNLQRLTLISPRHYLLNQVYICMQNLSCDHRYLFEFNGCDTYYQWSWKRRNKKCVCIYRTK